MVLGIVVEGPGVEVVAETGEVISKLEKASASVLTMGRLAAGELLKIIWRARRPLTTRLSLDFLRSNVWTSIIIL